MLSRNYIPYNEWSQFWVPDYVLKNTENTIHTKYLSQEGQGVFVAWLKSPNVSYDTEMENLITDFIYAGKDVILSKINDYTQQLFCEFNWQHYPFDTQVHFHLNIKLQFLTMFMFYLFRSVLWNSTWQMEMII